MYSFEAPKSTILQPRYWQVMLLLEALGEDPFCLFQLLAVVSIPWLPWLVATSLWSLPLTSHCLLIFSKWLFLCFYLMGIRVIAFRDSLGWTPLLSSSSQDFPGGQWREQGNSYSCRWAGSFFWVVANSFPAWMRYWYSFIEKITPVFQSHHTLRHPVHF